MHAFIQSVRLVAASDLALLWRFPRYAAAVVVIALVPALYALIYLSSVWDPNANTQALPVAIVNLDAGLEYQGRSVHLGTELTRGLVAVRTFGFRSMASVDAARTAVRRGDLAFAIVIPADFSANAVPGALPGAGKVTVIVSEGNNYASAGFARRFAEDLGHQANEILNEQRWEQVLAKADGSGRSLDDLRSGMGQLQAGLQALEADIDRHTALDSQFAGGVRQAEARLRQLESQWQPETDIQPVRAGIGRLRERQQQLASSLDQLRAAVDPSGGHESAEQEARGGHAVLPEGLHVSADASKRLGDGLVRVDARLGKLRDGLGAVGDSLHGVGLQMQRMTALQSPLASGQALAGSVAQLRMGVEMAGSMLPVSSVKPDGSARGLAESVEPVLEVMAPVANNGSAFAPNMVAMALWL
ncbi:MAG: YhgE/Pip family protein, partial [Burkholderiaceae bacterium]